MYRYFALVWNRRDARATSDAKLIASRLRSAGEAWEEILSGDGVMVFHSGSASRTHVGSCETRLLAESRGAVFGRIFRRGKEFAGGSTSHAACDPPGHPAGLSPGQPASRAERPHAEEPIDAPETARICTTRAAHLIDHYWGRYVALICDAQEQTVTILRDPTGGMPCFVTAYRDVAIVFSDMETCLSLGMLKFSINWKYVASYVPYSALQIRDTGLREVTEVQAGERLVLSWDGGEARMERTLLWKPAEIAKRYPI